MSEATELTTPALRVVKGNPTPEELAAVVAVVQGLAAAGDVKPHQPEVGTLAGGWKSYWHIVRQPLLPGREAWRGTFRR